MALSPCLTDSLLQLEDKFVRVKRRFTEDVDHLKTCECEPSVVVVCKCRKNNRSRPALLGNSAQRVETLDVSCLPVLQANISHDGVKHLVIEKRHCFCQSAGATNCKPGSLTGSRDNSHPIRFIFNDEDAGALLHGFLCRLHLANIPSFLLETLLPLQCSPRSIATAHPVASVRNHTRPT